MKWHFRLENMMPFGHFGQKFFVMREREGFNKIEIVTAQFEIVDKFEPFDPEKCAFLSGDGQFGIGLDDEIRSFLQQISDFAWEQGIRPNGSQDVAGELKATKTHLEDMRRIGGVSDWKKT